MAESPSRFWQTTISCYLEIRVSSEQPGRPSGLRVLGHPTHAALAAFPLALLSVSVLADGAGLLRGGDFWWRASFWAVVLGLCGALPTACAGLVDYVAIQEGHPATKTGMTHMLLMLAAVTFFGMDLLVRGSPAPPHGMARLGIVAIDVAGAVVLMIGGWYGGELVFAYGIGSSSEPLPANTSPAGPPSASRSERRG